MEYQPDLARRLKDEAYQRRGLQSHLYSIVKGDSREVKEEKRAIREKVWSGYDDELKKIDRDCAFQHACDFGKRFFEKIESDPDVIGWSWVLSSSPCRDERCIDLVGNYKKDVRKPYPTIPGCTCQLSEIYLYEQVEFKE